MTRAIWKGHLRLGEEAVPVKMYGAVQDRTVHFRLLHEKDRAPVEQRIVRKSDGKEVPKEDRRKAFPVDRDTMVMLQPEELDSLEPESSRDIHLCRFVPPRILSDQWYDRPYYLGPDEDEDAYFALAAALRDAESIGIARWVMRKKRYVGALRADGAYLSVITLRRAEQILELSSGRLPPSKTPDEREVALARQLVETIAGDFEPQSWRDEYHARVCDLIEAKARGEKVSARPPPRKAESGDLAAALERSLARSRESKVG